jgi:hypothetical protein
MLVISSRLHCIITDRQAQENFQCKSSIDVVYEFIQSLHQIFSHETAMKIFNALQFEPVNLTDGRVNEIRNLVRVLHAQDSDTVKAWENALCDPDSKALLSDYCHATDSFPSAMLYTFSQRNSLSKPSISKREYLTEEEHKLFEQYATQNLHLQRARWI